jgi:hydrogenase expression/formation protein HypC
MCLAVPMRIIEIGDLGMARGEVGGIVKEINLSLIDDVSIGDYVIAHVGFALSKLDPEDALQTLRLFAEAGMLDDVDLELGDAEPAVS